jgi:hypothetical protein
MCFIDIFLCIFGFCVWMFAIRYLFPEIRDEVPENVSKRLNFKSVLGMRLPPSRKAPAGQDGETGRGLPALRRGPFALAQGSSATRRRGRQRMMWLGRNCRAPAPLARGLGKGTPSTRMATNLTTLESTGFGQFVRIRERSRWDRRHRRQSRDGKRRASRETSEFQICVVD